MKKNVKFQSVNEIIRNAATAELKLDLIRNLLFAIACGYLAINIYNMRLSSSNLLEINENMIDLASYLSYAFGILGIFTLFMAVRNGYDLYKVKNSLPVAAIMNKSTYAKCSKCEAINEIDEIKGSCKGCTNNEVSAFQVCVGNIQGFETIHSIFSILELNLKKKI